MVNAFAVLQSATAAILGYVSITQLPGDCGKAVIHANLTGVSPGRHGFHIHQYGDLSNGCDSLGGHYNPFNRTHGAPTDQNRHVGDFGNIEVGEDGTANFTLTLDKVYLEGPYSVLGRGIVLHNGTDDLGKGGNPTSLENGNAGSRLACGVLGAVNPNVTHWA
ncbi:hypothetical protein VTP01DRAFT_1348 [Rhizomucor pusillus]|uniref:uncharacterized protein n=1 Tax=Rhizomucor pusillus TaxID=4840 RepID=UPI00374248AF